MIRHQAIGEYITVWRPFLPDFMQQVQVIIRFEEDLYTVIAPVVHMVDMFGFKMHRVGFGMKVMACNNDYKE